MSPSARRPVAAAAVAAVALALAPGAAGARDYAPDALNIIPSGQYGTLPPPPGAASQAERYDALTPLGDQVTQEDLQRTFKSAALQADGRGVPGPARTERVPRAGVRIVRDADNVPHITGRTRDDVTWAMGWVLQQDRGLLLAQARHPGRVAALDVPGVSAFGLVTQLKQFTATAAADRRIEREQLAALRGQGADGRALLHDIDVYVQGINARLRAEQSTQKPWTRVDVFAVNALLGQIFGEGGGDEARRSSFLSALQGRLGREAGFGLFDDLSERTDRTHSSTLTAAFKAGSDVPATPRGNVKVDAGSLQAASSRAVPHASNFVMVGRERSATGHPLFVGGPQIGYFYPGLTLEADIKGPGFEARGATAPGFPGNILIGRGPDFVWSLTSASSDLIDQFALRLCGGSRTRYRYEGRCRRMGSLKVGTIRGEGDVTIRTTVHGPLAGYATSDGRPIAITRDRASRGRDVLFQLAFRDLTLNKVRSPRTFFRAMAKSPFTFNAAYADDRDIAMYSAGRLPVRHPDVDSRLLTDGSGPYDWRGFLPDDRHPRQVAKPDGVLINWNNRPAPGWPAADNNWTWGSLHRVELLNAGIEARRTHDLPSVVGAMNEAATQDLRAVGLVPVIKRVLAAAPPPTARAKAAWDQMLLWSDAGGSRLDRDLDGVIDAGAGPAVMDAAYRRMADAALAPVLGPQLEELNRLVGADNTPRSGFTGGRVWILDKDLRTLLGDRVPQPYRTRFCGAGDLAACAASLWAAIDDAAAELQVAQGPDPAAWRADATKERISFAPGLLPTTIRYTNRPSGIQQVVSVSGHRPRR